MFFENFKKFLTQKMAFDRKLNPESSESSKRTFQKALFEVQPLVMTINLSIFHDISVLKIELICEFILGNQIISRTLW